jgi:acyl carrier protein
MSLTITQQRSATEEGFEIDKLRALVAEHLDVDVGLVTDEAYFGDDLGADWLDRLELMILIEDQFPGVEITDYDADQMEVVGDLIRYLRMGPPVHTCRPAKDGNQRTNARSNIRAMSSNE